MRKTPREDMTNPNEAIAKRALFLAYHASIRVGFGKMQMEPNVTEETLWNDMRTMERSRPGEVHADYAYGRMMKFYMRWTDTGIETKEYRPRPDYQTWCRAYPTYQILIEAAKQSLEKEKNDQR